MGPTATVTDGRPAFYAVRGGGWHDWWSLLHPPYTAWHLSYVVIGASLAPVVQMRVLLASVGAFFLAVGVSAHALDELCGRPLRTSISNRSLVVVAVLGLAGALTLGILGVVVQGPVLVPFLVVGPILVLAYNLELFGGAVHSDLGFALSWGAFPLLTAYVAEAQTLTWAPILAAAGATALSLAQRALSTPARQLRRKVDDVQGTLTQADGEVVAIDRKLLLAPLERALRALTWSVVLGAAALATARLA